MLPKLETPDQLAGVRDRMGVNMVGSREQAWLIGEDTVILEPASGNTRRE